MTSTLTHRELHELAHTLARYSFTQRERRDAAAWRAITPGYSVAHLSRRRAHEHDANAAEAWATRLELLALADTMTDAAPRTPAVDAALTNIARLEAAR